MDEHEHLARRFFHLRQRRDGGWAGDFRLTPELGQKLSAVLGPLMPPRTTRDQTGDADGQHGAQQVEPDLRTQGQRRHDAVEDVVDRLLRAADLPGIGGTPATVIIVMSYSDYVNRRGVARYADGTAVAAETALVLADQAEAWCGKAPTGAVLTLGRSRRIAIARWDPQDPLDLT